jgi:DNA-directed RNA polymerase subunit RPC12/RpoP
MSSNRMKLVSHVGKRVVFCGPISEGVGEHDYLCARCGRSVPRRVDKRSSCRAVYQCARCHALNTVEAANGRAYGPQYRW